MCGYLNFALREWDFVPDVHKKVHILLPLACDLNLVITSEASRVIYSCSFTGIFPFRYFNSTKGVKKNNGEWKKSISPIRLDCSIRAYLNFALRKQEKLNNFLPQFFCVYTNRHLIDTYSSFCVIAGGEIFSHSHVLLVSFSFFCSTGYVYSITSLTLSDSSTKF